jgi:hypothetical protein
MSNTSSDNRDKSESLPSDCAKKHERDKSNFDQSSDYYYDDATGYEVYKDDDEDDDAGEEVKNRER